MANTFLWGGQTWSYGDLAAFSSYLAAHGANYATWASNHPTAASILEVSPQTYKEQQGYNEAAAGLPTGVAYVPPPPTPSPAAPAAAPVESSPANGAQVNRNEPDPRVYQPATIQPVPTNRAQETKNEPDPRGYQPPTAPVIRIA